jgi:GWxTD domain-containing protein
VTLVTLAALDPTDTYRRAGFLTASGPVAFVGNIRFLAGTTADSTLAVVAVSLPSRSLTFSREGERYRATYEIELDLFQSIEGAARSIGHVRAREMVRVSTLRETTRDEESVIFQQFVIIPPGGYTAVLTVRDLGTNRSSTAEAIVTAPRFVEYADTISGADPPMGSFGIALPQIVHAATPRASRSVRPDLVMSARSTVIFGRDSVVPVYLEWYGVGAAGPAGHAPAVQLLVRSDDGQALYADSAVASAWGANGQVAATIVRLPVSRIGLGRLRVLAWHSGAADTAVAPLFVSAGDEVAAVSFDEMLSYLRHFTTTERLQALRDTTAEARPAAWVSFLRTTDPAPATPEHEGLREYLNRLGMANARFRGEDVPGWLSDRGMVFCTLGEPDRVIEPRTGEAGVPGRAQLWEYVQHRLRLVFVEQEGARRWRLTSASEAEFQTAAKRVRR